MEQSTPIFININYINVPETFANNEWLVTKFQFNLTLEHCWRDIQSLLWKKSSENFLKPVFLKYQANGITVRSENQKISEFLESGENTLNLVVDLVLINSRSIPVHRTPVDELFDILISYLGKTLKFRESVECGINALKDYILEREISNKRREHLKFYLVQGRNYTEIDDTGEGDEDVKLSDALKLDVPPLTEVSLLACSCPPYSSSTLHIRVMSKFLDDVLKFAVDRFASINEVKSKISEHIDGPFTLHYMSQEGIEDSNGPIVDILMIPRDHVKLHVVVQERIDGEEYFVPTPTRTVNESFEPSQLLKIVVSNGVEWTPTGKTFETIESNIDGEKLLVNQSDLVNLEYVFSALLEGEEKETTISLNTSQCMIVDNGFHDPYVLINPSGKAKLNRVFQRNGQSLIQEVKINQYDQSQAQRAPAPVESPVQNQRRNANQNPIQILQDIMNRMPAVPRAVPNPAPGAAPIPEPAQVPAAVPDVANTQPIPIPAPGRGPQGGRNNDRHEAGQPVLQVLLGIIMINLEQIFSRMVRYSFVIYMLGLHELIFHNFALILQITAVGSLLYAFFFTNGRLSGWIERTFLNGIDVNRRMDTRLASKLVTILKVTNGLFGGLGGLVSDFRNECINIAIDRERDFQFILAIDEQRTGVWFWINDSWNNLWKDILLYFLTLFPSSQTTINIKLEQWRSDESKVLKLALDQQMDVARIVLALYGVRHADAVLNRELEEMNLGELGTDIESLDLEESKEEYYQILLAQIREVKNLIRQCRAGTKKFAPIEPENASEVLNSNENENENDDSNNEEQL